MYEIHSSEGIILSVRPTGEADLVVTIFSQEYGLIRPRVHGARKHESKHRYHVQIGNVVSCSFVEGKIEPKLTGISTEHQILTTRHEIEEIQIVGRVLFLLEALVGGSEQDYELYQLCKKFLVFVLTQWHQVQFTEYKTELEPLVVACILSHLGYLDTSGLPQNLSLYVEDVFNEQNFKIMKEYRVQVVHILNEVMSQIHT